MSEINIWKEKISTWLGLDKDKFKNLANAERGWLIIISVSLVIIVFVLLTNFYFFMKINNEDFFLTIDQEKGSLDTKVDEKGLEEVIDSLNKKEINFDLLRKEKVQMIDPSL